MADKDLFLEELDKIMMLLRKIYGYVGPDAEKIDKIDDLFWEENNE